MGRESRYRGVRGQAAESVKEVPQQADSEVMPAFIDPPVVVRLRMLHRCLMCHKRCLIPCKFTALEFERMVEEELATLVLEAEKD